MIECLLRSPSHRYPSIRYPSRPALRLSAALAIAAGSLSSGCVERLIQVRTDPPGAEVTLNGDPVLVLKEGKKVPAVTPVDIPFDFYGTFEVAVRREGFLSDARMVPVSAPFYQYPPIDFFAENLIPWTIRDHHRVEILLRKTPELDDREAAGLFERMRSARAELPEPSGKTAAAE